MRTIEQALSQLAPSLLKSIAWPMLWQSSLLIGFIFLIDLALRRRLRPAVRYALWLLVLLKLMLPPSLALPTAVAWWIRPTTHRPDPSPSSTVVVNYRDSTSSPAPAQAPPPKGRTARSFLPLQAWLVLFCGAGSVALFLWMLRRWRYVAIAAKSAKPVPLELQRVLEATRESVGFKRAVRLRLSDKTSSPVVFGF